MSSSFVSFTLWAHLCILCFPGFVVQDESPVNHAPCSISRDSSHGGLRLDCSYTGMTSGDVENLVEEQTTTLILDGNPIVMLHNHSFHGLTDLVVLSLVNCELDKIEASAFQELRLLRELNLNSNLLRFREWSLPFCAFDPLMKLETLKLTGNQYYQDKTSYGESLNIFHSSKVLSSLYLDSFTNLRIGFEFAELRTLHDLSISCENMLNAYNNSLEGLRNSTVKCLTFNSGENVFYKDFDTGIFEPLPDLNRLSVEGVRIGNIRMLMAMKGLQYKSIRILELNMISQLGRTISTAYESFLDSFIRAEDTIYLARVRIHYLKWTNNDVFGFELDAVVTGVWKTCLQTLDVSGNNFFKGYRSFILNALRLQNLQTFTYSKDQAYPAETPSFWNSPVNSLPRSHDQMKYFAASEFFDDVQLAASFLTKVDASASIAQNHPRVSDSVNEERSSLPVYLNDDHDLRRAIRVLSGKKPIDMTGVTLSHVRVNNKHLNLRKEEDAVLIIYIPKFLKAMHVDNIYHTVMGVNISVKNADSLTDIYMRYSINPIGLQKNIIGLTRVERIDFTGSSLLLNENIFHFMPNLTTLVLRQTQRSPDFLQTRTEHLLRHNSQLEYLDLSHNSLSKLPSDAFLPNPRLRYLCLAANRFSRLPFLLSLTPNLEILDLRSNSFTSLSYDERQAMDAHQTRLYNFTVLLAGNALVCTCSTRSFTSWLRSTAVLFDNGGNYSCFTKVGGVGYTLMPTSAEKDLRRCEGWFYLMLSLTVLAVMVALYTGAFFGTRYHKLVISKVLRLMAPGFRIMSREDFSHDVFIGYADRDVEFVRYRLLPVLEGKWKLRTFVHHRDLLQDMLGLSQALRDSWRCLLILSENFLLRSEMAHHVMKNAAFFVSAANLKKLVVLVEERHQYSVPDYVLQVTEEDNILVVEDLATSFAPDVLQTLRHRLMN